MEFNHRFYVVYTLTFLISLLTKMQRCVSDCMGVGVGVEVEQGLAVKDDGLYPLFRHHLPQPLLDGLITDRQHF